MSGSLNHCFLCAASNRKLAKAARLVLKYMHSRVLNYVISCDKCAKISPASRFVTNMLRCFSPVQYGCWVQWQAALHGTVGQKPDGDELQNYHLGVQNPRGEEVL